MRDGPAVCPFGNHVCGRRILIFYSREEDKMALIVCPECGKEVSDQAENCIHCGFPLKNSSESTASKSVDIPQNRPTETTQYKPAANVDNSGCAKGCLVSVVIAFILIVLAFWCVAFSGNDSDSETSQRIAAITAAEMAVENRLKSPSTADFCSQSEMTISNVGSSWTVSGYVDAENSFGATVREYWTVTMTLSGDTAKNISVQINE